MSLRRDKPPAKGGRRAGNTKFKTSLAVRTWRLIVEHPRGVLIAGATLLGLIVVVHNWEWRMVKLLVWEPRLPLTVWALIFMLVGYLTGKWIEWAIQQRRIRKGIYKPRVSAEDLAGETKAIDEKLGSAPEAGSADPPTLIDRSKSSRPPQPSDGAVQAMDYWDDGAGGGAGAPDRLGSRDVPEQRSGRAGDYAEAGGRDGGGEPSRYHGERSGERSGEGGRYSDYSDYSDSGGRYGDYSDYTDSGGRRESGGRRSGGRYSDYADYADSGSGPRRGGGRRR